jgi:hypothetical protein
MAYIDPEDDPAPWYRVCGTTNDDGTIHAVIETNDNLDRGYPTEYARWEDTYKSLSSFRNCSGFSRQGCLGTVVEIELDGQNFTPGVYERLVKELESPSVRKKEQNVSSGIGFGM